MFLRARVRRSFLADFGSRMSSAVSSPALSSSAPLDYDVVVVGGGVVGAVLASRLARLCAGRTRLSIAVVEPRAPPPLSVVVMQEQPDLRVFAISPGSMRILGACGGAVDAIRATGRLAAFQQMQVWDALGPAHIRFSGEDINSGPESGRRVESDVSSAGGSNNSVSAEVDGSVAGGDDIGRRGALCTGAVQNNCADALGHIIESGTLSGALFAELQGLADSGQLDLICPARVSAIVAPPADTRWEMLRAARGGDAANSTSLAASSSSAARTTVTLHDGRVLRGRVVVGADGAASAVRAAANISTWGWGYDQVAVVATVFTEHAHGTAWQRFLPHGPVAVLPVRTMRYGQSSPYIFTLKRAPASALENVAWHIGWLLQTQHLGVTHPRRRPRR